jgi:hypothetical protein
MAAPAISDTSATAVANAIVERPAIEDGVVPSRPENGRLRSQSQSDMLGLLILERVGHSVPKKLHVPEKEGTLMTPNQVKTFATAIDMSRSDEVTTRLEEFDALVGNWLIDNSNSINLCSVEHQQSVASPQWMMLTVMVTYWVPVSVQEGEEESRS